MSSIAIVVLAVLGTVAICLGSFVAIVAPGDGQTGMVTFPLFFLGSMLGIGSIIGFLATRPGSGTGWCVAALAAIAIGSVIWSYLASAAYEHVG